MDGDRNMMDFYVDHDGWITIPADQFRADLEWAVKDTLKRKVPAP